MIYPCYITYLLPRQNIKNVITWSFPALKISPELTCWYSSKKSAQIGGGPQFGDRANSLRSLVSNISRALSIENRAVLSAWNISRDERFFTKTKTLYARHQTDNEKYLTLSDNYHCILDNSLCCWARYLCSQSKSDSLNNVSRQWTLQWWLRYCMINPDALNFHIMQEYFQCA